MWMSSSAALSKITQKNIYKQEKRKTSRIM